MGKERAKPVIWLLLWKKIPLKRIIQLGFNKTTVYRYSSQFAFVKEDFKAAMKRLKEMVQE